jgi:hypothetical protein
MDPKQRANIGAALKARWANPEVREKYMIHHADATVRKTRAAALKARWDDPAERERIIAAMKAARFQKKRKITKIT